MEAARPTFLGASFAARHWYRLSPVSVLLFPFSLVFRLLVALRRLLFRLGVLPSVRLKVPVIIVGNLTVGGTGKTPLILALAEELRRAGAGMKEPIVVVNADNNASYQSVIRVMDASRQAGYGQVVFAVEQSTK